MEEKKQVRFVIFGQGRSGNTLLNTLLKSHPDIVCDGELLRSGYWGKVFGQVLVPICRVYPIPLFKFMAAKNRPEAYGFKLFIDHLYFPSQVLTQMSSAGWKILYLERRDTVTQAISMSAAIVSHRWHRNKSGEKNNAQSTTRLVLSPEIVINNLRKITKERKQIVQMIALLPHLHINYENDLADSSQWHWTMARILDYLGLPERPLSTHLAKTYDRPYSEVIANYAVILKAIQCSDYANLIEPSSQAGESAK